VATRRWYITASSMLAIEISRHGGPGVLRPVERPDPVPSADEILVRNRWIGGPRVRAPS